MLTLLGFAYMGQAQEKLRTSKGRVDFNASTPLQDIEAKNKEVNAILELASGRLAVVMLIQDFQFRRELMEEHFNENYMESDKFPKAYFTGQIRNYDPEAIDSSPKRMEVDGQLTIHGVTRDIREEIEIRRGPKSLEISSSFIVRPADHDIEVPRLVFKKIAEEVEVSLNFELN